jgi:predicted DNA repair protein MutK
VPEERLMAAGLVALLDDVSVLARAAAASVDDIGLAAGRASAKAAGVVVDDTAVTPQYVQGLAAERELPIIRRIAKGSLRNKLLIILPVALVLSQFLPVLLAPILMLGGAYLCYEGAEKVWEKLGGGHHAGAHPDTRSGTDAPVLVDEDTVVTGAVRTDFILSAEIMVISLNEVADEPFVSRAVILVVVALGITALVYGVVGIIVKMDDLGLSLAQRGSAGVARFGRALVRAMPRLLAVIAVVGTAAMLWVGGHILLVGADELGWHGPYDLVHHLEDAAHDAAGAVGGVAGWTVNTLASAVVGLVVGAVVVLAMTLIARARQGSSAAPGH